jgi:uncharacterized RDD family membrane protein YckC
VDAASSTSDPEDGRGPTAASLPLRFAAMVYEGVLLFGIAFAAGLLLLTTTGWTAPLLAWQRLVLQALVFVALGIYFCWCWIRSGQTLALKTWDLRAMRCHGRCSCPGSCTSR